VAKVSLLLRGYLKSFSLERLSRFLNDLGQDIYIKITPSSHHGHGSTTIGDFPHPTLESQLLASNAICKILNSQLEEGSKDSEVQILSTSLALRNSVI